MCKTLAAMCKKQLHSLHNKRVKSLTFSRTVYPLGVLRLSSAHTELRLEDQRGAHTAVDTQAPEEEPEEVLG